MGESSEIANTELLLAGMLGMFVLALGIVFFFLAYQRRLLKQQKEHQQKEADYQQQLLRANLESQEKERNRIGKDLHDEIGALLTTSKLYFRHLDQKTPGEEFDGLKHKVLGILDDTIASVRRVSHDLRPVVLETLGLVEAIGSLAEQVNESGEITLDFQHQLQGRLEKEEQLNWYRIVQELINNTIKHAQATKIEIELVGKSGAVRVNYRDNGIGLGAQHGQHGGLGLSNIESRLNLMNGELTILESEVRGIHFQMLSGKKENSISHD